MLSLPRAGGARWAVSIALPLTMLARNTCIHCKLRHVRDQDIRRRFELKVLYGILRGFGSETQGLGHHADIL